jgi:hypothetical protein
MLLFMRELWGCIVSDFQPNLPGPVFDQPEIENMRRALDSASKALAFSYGPSGEPDQGVRTALARAILGQASNGERNPEVLSSLALRELPPRSAYWVPDTKKDLQVA